ncbi:MAG: helix-turn-helix domain-containing protein [Novosphingobium sp.]|jgi:IclR family pca regulon transcriptional regulator|nr:helix-turn-helix domain-containing protein [Novosphingobium sp.]
MDEADRNFVQGLARGLAVIESFDREHPEMTLSQVARRIGESPASTRRMLMTLRALGYVGADRDRFFPLPRMLRLGHAYLSALPLATVVQPRLTELTRELDESSSLAVLDGTDIVIVARATARRLTEDYMVLGYRLPAHATSVGKVLLASPAQAGALDAMLSEPLQPMTRHTIAEPQKFRAELARIARQGWALNDQETREGIRSIAVPVILSGTSIAALSVSAATSRMTAASLVKTYLPPLQGAAASLSAALVTAERGQNPRRRAG